jgi:GT2 family glycosyltransferase
MLGYQIYCISKALAFHKVSAITKGSENPINYYYSERNELVTMFKNLEISNIFRYLIFSFLIHLLIALYQFATGRRLIIIYKIRAWFDFLRKLRSSVRKRDKNRTMRKIRDSDILKFAHKNPFLTILADRVGHNLNIHTEHP